MKYKSHYCLLCHQQLGWEVALGIRIKTNSSTSKHEMIIVTIKRCKINLVENNWHLVRLVVLCIDIFFFSETKTFKPSTKPVKTPSKTPTKKPTSKATGYLQCHWHSYSLAALKTMHHMLPSFLTLTWLCHKPTVWSNNKKFEPLISNSVLLIPHWKTITVIVVPSLMTPHPFLCSCFKCVNASDHR